MGTEHPHLHPRSLQSGKLFTAEAQEIVNKTLASLPEQTRRIFIMSRYENKPYKEIAETLGMTTKGVEYHIAQALKSYMSI